MPIDAGRIIRAETDAPTPLARGLPGQRSVTGKTPLLHEHRYALKTPSALKGHLAEGIVLVVLCLRVLLQADQKILVGPHHSRSYQFYRQALLVVSKHLDVVFGGVETIESTVGKVIVQNENVRIGASVQFAQQGIVSLQGTFFRYQWSRRCGCGCRCRCRCRCGCRCGC